MNFVSEKYFLTICYYDELLLFIVLEDPILMVLDPKKTSKLKNMKDTSQG